MSIGEPAGSGAGPVGAAGGGGLVGPGSIEDLSRVIAAAAVPGIVSLTAGPAGQYRLRLPDRDLVGVTADEREVDLHVIVAFGTDLQRLPDLIVERLGPALLDRVLTVHVEDVVDPRDDNPRDDDHRDDDPRHGVVHPPGWGGAAIGQAPVSAGRPT